MVPNTISFVCSFVGCDTRGHDAGKKVNGRKRSIVTDALGLLLTVVVVTAAVQDRDGAKPALRQRRNRPKKLVFKPIRTP